MQGCFDYSADLHQSLLLRHARGNHISLSLGIAEADIRRGNVWANVEGYVRRPLSVMEKIRRKFLHAHSIPAARKTCASVRPHDNENFLGDLPRDSAKLLLLHMYAARREEESAKLNRDDLPYEERVSVHRILDAVEGYYREVVVRVLGAGT